MFKSTADILKGVLALVSILITIVVSVSKLMKPKNA